MKLKTIYFAGIVTVCLLAFIGCNSTINEETDYTGLEGEYHFIGYRLDDGEWIPKGNKFDDIINFNGTSHAEGKYIYFEKLDLPADELPTEFEFDLNNGKFRFRYLYPYPLALLYEDVDEWEYGKYNFNNDVLELKFEPNNIFYWVYKKI